MKVLKIFINGKTLSAAAFNCLKELDEKGFIQNGMIVYEDNQEDEVKRILDAMNE